MTIDLTVAEASHLLTLLNERIEDGTYYGNREQYYARSERIYQKIMDEVNKPKLCGECGGKRTIKGIHGEICQCPDCRGTGYEGEL